MEVVLITTSMYSTLQSRPSCGHRLSMVVNKIKISTITKLGRVRYNSVTEIQVRNYANACFHVISITSL